MHVRTFQTTYSTLKQTAGGAVTICIKGPGGGMLYFQHQKLVTEFTDHIKMN